MNKFIVVPILIHKRFVYSQVAVKLKYSLFLMVVLNQNACFLKKYSVDKVVGKSYTSYWTILLLLTHSN